VMVIITVCHTSHNSLKVANAGSDLMLPLFGSGQVNCRGYVRL